ncbi:MAG TPA: hypothetical protein VLJ14_18695, partial [Ktedonobacterales bacterium]|nr:hypothetical protein [Ktedonobacterales bacterium]
MRRLLDGILPSRPLRRVGRVRSQVGSTSTPAMLTGMVNIAVFAAFSIHFDLRSGTNAAFKPICRDRP